MIKAGKRLAQASHDALSKTVVRKRIQLRKAQEAFSATDFDSRNQLDRAQRKAN